MCSAVWLYVRAHRDAVADVCDVHINIQNGLCLIQQPIHTVHPIYDAVGSVQHRLHVILHSIARLNACTCLPG